ncbi:hypothetical protein QSJ19_06050 [Gordonia sp. ABSL11-1]|uniref:hypothetical protein n=1 Tax=Gordonia sp. ABSL11-1 TaxID=3053924 RepID=UPI0025725969|nr:hypothetical protein [Gordonia sp. ABSL11-1]MDL9945158.1 hypothetical protein [Gordonia sp. ABSL11-1]
MTAPIHPAPTDPGTRPERPDAISIATELWAVVILGQLVAFIGQYPWLRDAWDRQIRTLPADTPAEQVEMLNSSGTLIVVLAIFGVALTAVSTFLVLMTRSGYNWARIIVAAMGVFITVNVVFTLFGDIEPQWVMIPMIISGVAALGGSVLLLRRESEQYCRDMTAHRRRPQYPPPGAGPGASAWPGGPGHQQGQTPPWTYGGGQHNPPQHNPPQHNAPQPNPPQHSNPSHHPYPHNPAQSSGDRPPSNEGNDNRGES